MGKASKHFWCFPISCRQTLLFTHPRNFFSSSSPPLSGLSLHLVLAFPNDPFNNEQKSYLTRPEYCANDLFPLKLQFTFLVLLCGRKGYFLYTVYLFSMWVFCLLLFHVFHPSFRLPELNNEKELRTLRREFPTDKKLRVSGVVAACRPYQTQLNLPGTVSNWSLSGLHFH